MIVNYAEYSDLYKCMVCKSDLNLTIMKMGLTSYQCINGKCGFSYVDCEDQFHLMERASKHIVRE